MPVGEGPGQNAAWALLVVTPKPKANVAAMKTNFERDPHFMAITPYITPQVVD
jgi:hypothetical protein